jgi:outer membrane protein OmpA-like peptidoglycan-associated protein
MHSIENWQTSNHGTTDVFSTCANNHVGVPKNYNGYQKAKDGYNYVGCYFYTKDNKNYREYIQGELKTKLKKGKKYEVSFYISLADISDYAIKNIDFYFSNRNVIAGTSKTISINKMSRYRDFILHFYKIENDKYYRDKTNWINIKKTITAKGYEKYITIGNFEKDKNIKKVKVKRKDQKIAYYYIDLVSVKEVEIKENKPKLNIEAKKNMHHKSNKDSILKQPLLKLNKTYIFKNVTFDFNSSVLKEKAKIEIEYIYHILITKDVKNKIIISGHTDNIGDAIFNQNLSEKRAHSVMQYFIELGLKPSRISAIGYGKSKPLIKNSSEENRSKNRRVEFKLIQ